MRFHERKGNVRLLLDYPGHLADTPEIDIMPMILFVSGPDKGKTLEVQDKEIVLGRNQHTAVPLDDTQVSGEHLALRLQDDAWWAYDLRSSNGTAVNGAKIDATALTHGDEVAIGGSVFRFLLRDDSPREAVPARPAPRNAAKLDAAGNEIAEDDLELVHELAGAYARMREQIGRVIIGQDDVIEQVLITIFCRGHALLVGVPGLAKTLMISTLGHVLDLTFKRIQFTPDLMPSDITGTEIIEEDPVTRARRFRFVNGPIFTNVLLADEINRTPPKTQAALLEAMQEHRVTVGDKTHHLPEPFFVLATQNPIEQEGTYPLPEAQLDRFLFNIVVGYPTRDEELAIIRQVTGPSSAKLEVALTAPQVLRLQQLVRRVPVGDHALEFARDLARMSRPNEPGALDFVKEYVSWGAGPRAGIALVTAAKARAILKGRHHATTADIRAVAAPVLRHRVLTTFTAEAAGIKPDDVVRMLLDAIQPPGGRGE